MGLRWVNDEPTLLYPGVFFLCVMLVKTISNLSQKWVTSLTQLFRILGRLVPDLCGRPLGGDVHWFHVTQPG